MMKKNAKMKCLAGIAGLVGLPAVIFSPVLFDQITQYKKQAKADVSQLEKSYDRWLTDNTKNGESKQFDFKLGWSKALSNSDFETTGGLSGSARIDYGTGQVTLSLEPAKEKAYSFWIVDNLQNFDNYNVSPQKQDNYLYIGDTDADGKLDVKIDKNKLASLMMDLAVVTEKGQHPADNVVLTGNYTLYQRRYAQNFVYANQESSNNRILAALGISSSHAENAMGSMATLVAEGSRLFFEEKFNGNGRTCGTCHRAERNFTIDADFIATLPDNDPLFVAEYVPALSKNFENPLLMRKLGLILENVDGADDLANKFTMRGVPHTLGLQVSLNPGPPGADGTTIPPEQRTGWSGDGAPGSGTLRDFATGAVNQHFTKTLARRAGVDFRLPTDYELDAMEAFQLALGRQQDLDLASMEFTDPVVSRGKELFLASDTVSGTQGAGKCNQCHSNAGATVVFIPGANFNFDTGVENMPDQPAVLIDPDGVIADGGFGKEPHATLAGAFGNGTFNTPPLVEAADTAPYFHNNSVSTIEDAVAFYNSKEFNESPAGLLLASTDSAGIAVKLAPTQVEAIAAFLRVINSLENIRSSIDTADTVKSISDEQLGQTLLSLMLVDIGDAIRVLKERNIQVDAVERLLNAEYLGRLAQNQDISSISCFFFFCRNVLDTSGRNNLIDSTKAELAAARHLMLNEAI
jgi:cytochrome c peroxidase